MQQSARQQGRHGQKQTAMTQIRVDAENALCRQSRFCGRHTFQFIRTRFAHARRIIRHAATAFGRHRDIGRLFRQGRKYYSLLRLRFPKCILYNVQLLTYLALTVSIQIQSCYFIFYFRGEYTDTIYFFLQKNSLRLPLEMSITGGLYSAPECETRDAAGNG
jgi:hypothetical protein